MSSERIFTLQFLGSYFIIGLVLTVIFRTLYLKNRNDNPIVDFMGETPMFTVVAWAPWLFFSLLFYLIEYLPKKLAKR